MSENSFNKSRASSSSDSESARIIFRRKSNQSQSIPIQQDPLTHNQTSCAPIMCPFCHKICSMEESLGHFLEHNHPNNFQVCLTQEKDEVPFDISAGKLNGHLHCLGLLGYDLRQPPSPSIMSFHRAYNFLGHTKTLPVLVMVQEMGSMSYKKSKLLAIWLAGVTFGRNMWGQVTVSNRKFASSCTLKVASLSMGAYELAEMSTLMLTYPQVEILVGGGGGGGQGKVKVVVKIFEHIV